LNLFSYSTRLLYICPTGFDDGLPIEYEIADFDIEDAVTELKLGADKVNICLVDGFDTYDCTIRDLTCAYEILADGGVLVVHDCSPKTEALASPTFVPQTGVECLTEAIWTCSHWRRFELMHIYGAE
jgi:hypothetical protein